ncbi:hypothetical protein BO224_05305 [Erysipelotrichaceae bacterium NYU-BL-E8]|uniref:Uncharacterized protein n=1 Tax=Ileibacterium valens TaxID=1862668 RepID=A0A1U7NG89_9FIRM|nr:hypothetical protein BO222_06220 [Ileibacterium valens]OLU40350.1 hypothetical protein BM735_05730 [Erysipelotrichaceae bacterium NYU-BL-F16]OLU40575.1 hypothetical protein BO224_05305 [Erysipelotrichaceae bacterium NYU-BL-E8]
MSCIEVTVFGISAIWADESPIGKLQILMDISALMACLTGRVTAVGQTKLDPSFGTLELEVYSKGVPLHLGNGMSKFSVLHLSGLNAQIYPRLTKITFIDQHSN